VSCFIKLRNIGEVRLSTQSKLRGLVALGSTLQSYPAIYYDFLPVPPQSKTTKSVDFAAGFTIQFWCRLETAALEDHEMFSVKTKTNNIILSASFKREKSLVFSSTEGKVVVPPPQDGSADASWRHYTIVFDPKAATDRIGIYAFGRALHGLERTKLPEQPPSRLVPSEMLIAFTGGKVSDIRCDSSL
jgi:hypothetical protein